MNCLVERTETLQLQGREMGAAGCSTDSYSLLDHLEQDTKIIGKKLSVVSPDLLRFLIFYYIWYLL